MDKNEKITKHGNHARIDPQKEVVPLYLTCSVTDNKTDENGNVVNVQDADAVIAKREVDQNHK